MRYTTLFQFPKQNLTKNATKVFNNISGLMIRIATYLKLQAAFNVCCYELILLELITEF